MATNTKQKTTAAKKAGATRKAKAQQRKYEVWQVVYSTFGMRTHDFPAEFRLVAEVEAADLDDVFRKTNSIDRPWRKNPGVVTVGPPARDTSVGDVVVAPDGTAHRCEHLGWSQIGLSRPQEIEYEPGVQPEIVEAMIELKKRAAKKAAPVARKKTMGKPPAVPSLREIVWKNGGRKCARCERPLEKKSACNVDPIDLTRVNRRGPSMKVRNLRCLCRACYVLRCGPKGMARSMGAIDKAVADGVIPFDWRPLVWEG